ncbi:thiamine pyrophosphate enzyme, TPP binding domain protein, partial [Teladorsagia circumcincta]
VDENSKNHGGELVASVLKSHDVQEIFVLCGGHISPILVAAEKLGIKIIDTRHEVTTVFAADAVARLRQSIGVAAVTAGPGLTNTITAVKNAQMAESPLLLIGGAAPTLLKGRGALQKALNFYLRCHVSRQFSAAWQPQDITPLPTQIPMPAFEEVDKIVRLISSAKKPVMLIGSQAMLPPVVPKDLVKAVELLGVPVYLGGMARGLLGKENRLQMRQNRKDALRDADLTILAGHII